MHNYRQLFSVELRHTASYGKVENFKLLLIKLLRLKIPAGFRVSEKKSYEHLWSGCPKGNILRRLWTVHLRRWVIQWNYSLLNCCWICIKSYKKRHFELFWTIFHILEDVWWECLTEDKWCGPTGRRMVSLGCTKFNVALVGWPFKATGTHNWRRSEDHRRFARNRWRFVRHHRESRRGSLWLWSKPRKIWKIWSDPRKELWLRKVCENFRASRNPVVVSSPSTHVNWRRMCK